MPRLSASRSKGQWFLISAVIATGAFLAISLLYQGYFVTDPSRVLYSDMNQQFLSIRTQLHMLSDNGGWCDPGTLDNVVRYNTQTMMEKGYFLTVIADGGCDYKLILLSSGDYDIWEGERVSIEGVS